MWTSDYLARRMRKVVPLLFVAAAWCSCTADGDDSSPHVADLQAFAFPSTVEPNGAVTIAVKVNRGECKDNGTCLVCVGMPGGGGRLFAPAGLNVEDGKSVALPAADLALNSLVYVAPDHEGSEVVSAALFKASVTTGKAASCAGLNADNLVGTATVRILIKNPPSVEEPVETAGAGGVADSGGTGGAPPGGTGATGGTGGAAGSGGQGGTGGSAEGGMPGAGTAEGGTPGGAGGLP